ncbi:hypothetical protein MOQ72_23975 [Saccharopolyspora sp. K220]|uniref:hypothetical protein n=1 Tax=Saccharopolyspora soli TaxID=2926618 RepID=UPI001F57514A|nr:hypothetical protein [Saccharopolyspora soli]MCI2420512.1 hypothetical protein [Saccharopolyspora soli]
MSSPGNWGSNEYRQQYDPHTGQPVAGGPGPSGQQPGMQYQGFGAFSQAQPPQQPPPPAQPYAYPNMASGYPAPPTPPGKRRGPLIAAIALAAVAVIAIVTTVVVLSTSGGGDQAAPTAAPTRSSTPTRPTTSAASPSSAVANPNLTPVVPGWQVVSVPRRGAVYDVPPNWKLDPNPDNIHGFGPPDDPVTMTGVADYQLGFCPGDANSYRATAGATARNGPDDTTVANETLQKFAALAYTRDGHAPVIVPGPPEQLQLAGGTTPAVRVTAQVTLTAPGPCDSASVLVSVLATNSDGQSSVVFVTAADQNVPDAVSIDTLEQITQSFRGAPA